MTLLEKIMEIAHEACPEFEVHAGFNADIHDFLAQHAVTGPLIFIGVAAEVPDEYSEDGRVVTWKNAFHLFVRASTKSRLAGEVYNQYLALREAFNGVEVMTDGGNAFIQIVSGENLQYASVREASISLLAAIDS